MPLLLSVLAMRSAPCFVRLKTIIRPTGLLLM